MMDSDSDSDSDDSLYMYLDSFDSDSDDEHSDASNHSNAEQETTTGTEAATDTRPAETKATFLYHGVTISVVSGSIQKEQAEVIVNSTSKDLNLRNGTASRVLLEEAGDEIQNECREKYPNEISEGELAVTGPGKLKCKFIYHGALVKYVSKDSEKIQMGFLKKCLDETNKQKLTSIAIPGLGTGFLGFPRDKVAQNVQNVVKQHVDSNPSSSIADVRFVLHHEDKLSLKAFETKLSSWEEKEKEKKAQSVCSLDIGKIRIEVKIGKLQNEEVDVIVNGTNTKIDLEKGIPSKEISQAAGKSLKDECKKKYPRGLKEGEIALTGAGNLKCKRIYHVCLKDYKTLAQEASEKALTDLVYKCLTTADEKKRISIAIPALGSKRHKYPAKVCASGTWKAIELYTKAKGSKAVTDIRIVLFGEGHKELVEAYKQEVMAYLRASGTTSPRGTTGFCREMYAKEINPPSYWMHYTLEKSVKEWKSETHDQGYYKLLKVDDSVKSAVEELIMNTWEAAKVGRGRDASGLAQLGYDSITVTEVQRLENIDLYENYGHTRARLFHKAGQIGVFENLEDISGSQGQITTTSFIDDDNILKRELYHEVNEHFLFHGTKPETFDHILAQGLDSRMGGEKGMFGQGMYLAESSTKADQYTDPKFDRNKEEKKMFLVRVCLGKICLLTSAQNTLHRPPCFVKGCNSDSCQHEEVNRCDSVICDKSWIFREFVIYSPYQAYPEYVITYKRK